MGLNVPAEGTGADAMWMTVNEAAAALGVSRSTVVRMIERGELVGRHVRGGAKNRSARIEPESVRRHKLAN